MTEHVDEEAMDDESLQGGDLDRLYDEEEEADGMSWDGLEDDLEDELEDEP